jgi:hypothetical protein
MLERKSRLLSQIWGVLSASHPSFASVHPL